MPSTLPAEKVTLYDLTAQATIEHRNCLFPYLRAIGEASESDSQE